MGAFKELQGKRTYILAGALLVWGILGFLLQKHDIQATITTVLQAAALLGLRAAIKKPE